MNDNSQYKILSLDGGGSWALVEVRCLQKLFGENISGHEVLKHFDLAIANSGGALVLAAMMANFTLSGILEMFRNPKKLDKIFSPVHPYLPDFIRRWSLNVFPRYSTHSKLTGLRQILNESSVRAPGAYSFSNSPLSGLGSVINAGKTDFVIISYDYYLNRAVFFRSNSRSLADTINLPNGDPQNTHKFSEVTIAEAVHASSNAPVTYFDQPARINYGKKIHRFWDGGITGNNNPVLMGVVEAIANGVERENIRVLSIGVGNSYLPVASATVADQTELVQEEKKWHWYSLPTDIKKIARSIINDPPDLATYVAYKFLFGNSNETKDEFIRLNPTISLFFDHELANGERRWKLPSGLKEEEFKNLKNLELDAKDKNGIDLLLNFCEHWISDEVRNQPIRMNTFFDACIGHDKFSDAVRACRTWL